MRHQHLSSAKAEIANSPTQTTTSIGQTQSNPILQLQATVGNQAVNQRLATHSTVSKLTQPKFRGLSHQLAGVSPIQAQLEIRDAGDRYEQEADRVAAQVVNQINGPISPSVVQEESVQRQALTEFPDQLMLKPVIQRQIGTKGVAATADVEQSINRVRGHGQQLSEQVRSPMEQAFGADFSGVRIHTDAQSDQLNRSIQALAFTTGQDVFFRQGAYNPGSREGQKLIAHELTHVVQQNTGIQPQSTIHKQDSENVISRKRHKIGLSGAGWTDDSYFEVNSSVGVFPETGIFNSSVYSVEHNNVVSIPGEKMKKGGATKGILKLFSSYTILKDDTFLTGGDKEESSDFTSVFDYQVGYDGSVLLTKDPDKTQTTDLRYIFQAEAADRDYEVYVMKDLRGSGLENINQRVLFLFHKEEVTINSSEKTQTNRGFNIGGSTSGSASIGSDLTLQLDANGKDILLLVGGAKLLKGGINTLKRYPSLQKIIGNIDEELLKLLEKQNLTYKLNPKMVAEIAGDIGFSYKYERDFEETREVTSSYVLGGKKLEEVHNIQISQNRAIGRDVFFESDQETLSDASKEKIDNLIEPFQKEILRPDSRVKVFLRGSADRTADPEYNQELSEKRASNVRFYIMDEFGLGREHFVLDAVGEERASQTVTDSADRSVSIKIIEQ